MSTLARADLPFVAGGELLVTPYVDAFYASDRNDPRVHGESPAMKRVGELLMDLATRQPRDRSGSLSASATGSCPKAQVFQYLGVPAESVVVDPKMMAVFDDGHWRHLRWQALLAHALPGKFQPEVQYRRTAHPRLIGSLDGVWLGAPDGQPTGIEIKGTRAFDQALEGVFHSHLLQVHAYMVLSGLTRFSVIYEDKATQEYVEHVVHEDPEVREQVLAKVGEVIKAIRGQDLPPILRACRNQDTTTFYDCGWSSICHAVTTWEQAEASVVPVVVRPAG